MITLIRVGGLFAILVLQAPLAFAQSAEVSAEKLERFTQAYAELRRQNPQLEERSREQLAADLQRIERARLARIPDTSVVTARSAEGRVAATARCKQGYVVKGTHRATDPNASIVSAAQRDCDGRGCRAYAVSAASKNAGQFDLTVSVDCST